jgi:predicted RNase H-like HicB family nuclease
MQTNSIIVEISYSGKNFGAHLPLLPGCVATAATPKAIKEAIAEAIEFHLEGSRSDGDKVPVVFSRNYSLVYKFDPPGFFTYYKGIFSNAALERITGINQKQLQHYATGLKKPRPAQAKKIETALHHLGSELMAVEL